MVTVENKFTFLENLTSNIPHSGSTFYSHLYHTGYLLWKMGEPEYLCDAGLYHSVYDTSYFKANLNVSRNKVKEIIGEKAEELVFNFCRLENRTLTLLNSHFEKNMHIDLLKIEYVNYIEQNRSPHNNIEIIKKIQYKILELEFNT